MKKVILLIGIIGTTLLFAGCSKEEGKKATVEDGVQKVASTVTANRYEAITVQKGVPVQWTLTVADGELTNCNNAIIIPEYNIEKQLNVGDNLVEFTPTESGTFPFSCWMGMIDSEISVTD